MDHATLVVLFLISGNQDFTFKQKDLKNSAKPNLSGLLNNWTLSYLVSSYASFQNSVDIKKKQEKKKHR